MGVGVDLVEIHRIRHALHHHGGRFLERVFTPGEQAYCRDKADPAMHLAARFAAKEAVLKVLGTGWSRGIAWTDVEVLAVEGGAPQVVLGGVARAVAAEKGIERVLLSLSHGEEHAVAFAVGEGDA